LNTSCNGLLQIRLLRRAVKMPTGNRNAVNAIFAKIGRFASEEVILGINSLKMFTNPYLWIGSVCFV